MHGFRIYVDHLQGLLPEAWVNAETLKRISPVLDGEPTLELRRLVSLEKRRLGGAFFTGSELAVKVCRIVGKTLTTGSTILDPACGAGDLLLACAQQLPVEKTLFDTLSRWGEQLAGRDVQHQFVRAAKLRLTIKALSRFGVQSAKPPPLDDLFPSLVAGNCRSDTDAFREATHVVLNPPYGQVIAPATCKWGAGMVTEAALFVDACVAAARPHTHIVAILPDVLRSGSRYRKWRESISRTTQVMKVERHGLFDASADVDVFLLHIATTTKRSKVFASNWATPAAEALNVNDFFEARIGAVVDYRDKHEGKWRPYLSAKGLPRWKEVASVPRIRRSKTTPAHPPFVVVRRTSRPGDQHRAVATIIRGPKAVVVDNHLIVLTPRDQSLRQCRQLLRHLMRRETTIWLNERIRCRHLTVSALVELPWDGGA